MSDEAQVRRQEVRIAAADLAAFAGWRDDIVDLYQTVFSQPPWNEGVTEVRAFDEALPDLTVQPGFVAILAHQADRLVGMALA